MKKLLSLSFIVAMMSLSSAPAQAGCYSDGVRIGTIQKFSKKGFIYNSWEGELVMGGLKTSKEGNISNVWVFSVLDASVAKSIDNAAMSGEQVSLRYCQSIPLQVTTDTDYRITQVTIRNK
jgi:hypothetical protein